MHWWYAAPSVKVGDVLVRDNIYWKVMKHQHTVAGRGSAFYQVELKKVAGPGSATKRQERWRPQDEIDLVDLCPRYLMKCYTSLAIYGP